MIPTPTVADLPHTSSDVHANRQRRDAEVEIAMANAGTNADSTVATETLSSDLT